MRRLTLALLLLVVACRQERPAPPAPQQNRPPAPKPAAAVHPPLTPPKVNRSTPDRCAGDGSYGQAVDCFRSTSRAVFSIVEPKGLRAEGEMTRSTIGAEREQFTLHGAGRDDGEWSAETKATGVIWTHGGKRTPSEPPVADRIWQRTTLYIDPQKKEGEAQRAGNESVGGEECIRYRFTDANNGDLHDVWISTADGHIVRIKVEGHGAFPSYEMRVTKARR
jgi:hypothetical protein